MHSDFNRSEKSFETVSEVVTHHAWRRMCGRSVSPDDISSVLMYGRAVYVRGAQIHSIGKQEVKEYKKDGVDLSHAEGIHVVCSPDNQVIITVYRNHDFRNLKHVKRGRKSRQKF
ncbi:MAG: DUF4258 domain-containing protein [Desulfamplus sp.]|nr:DUF4258 domain-containing protein [Desulfamplus sp.]